MIKNKFLMIVACAMIAGTAACLARLHAKQKLGEPAVKTTAIPQSIRLHVELPERVLDYESREVEVAKEVLDFLPKDTSFGQRLYTAPDSFWTALNVVLMGSDRTSLHQPEFCLEGQGWRIDPAASSITTIHLERPEPYDLPIIKLLATSAATDEKGHPIFDENGRTITLRRVYVYWFVAPDQYTARHRQRMWWMARDLMRTGVLQRWAYVTVTSVCRPGQEDATFERMKKFIAASVPEFQLTPRPKGAMISARQ